jgi:hypothetical protein
MKTAAGTRLHFAGEEGVLFSEPRQEVHAFNTTACVIWCHLEKGMTRREIATALANGSGLDPLVARAHVDAALADWMAKGLLSGGPPVPGGNPPESNPLDLPLPPGDGFVTCRTWRILGVTVRVRFARETDADAVRPLFDHLPSGDGTEPRHVVDIAPAAGGIGLYLDGTPAAFCVRGDGVAPLAKGVIWTVVLRRQDYLLHIHAGVVGGPAGCVLLPAGSGSGKSTLTLAMVHAGFDLFSDEVALLAAGDLTVSPFPTAICVKDTGIDIVADMYPAIRALPLHQREDLRRVAYLPPPAGSMPPEPHRRQVCGIVFPHYRPGASMTRRRPGPAEAFARLLGQCQNVGRALGHPDVRGLVEWIAARPCFEIEYGSLAQVRTEIGALLRGHL